MGHRRGGGLRQVKHLRQSPFTGQFFYITTIGIAFYQSNLSTSTRIPSSFSSEQLMEGQCWNFTYVEQSMGARSKNWIVVPARQSPYL